MTLPPHGPPEITEAQQAATSLGEVEDPTPDNVSRALQDYSPYAVASAAASLGVSGGGGGGSQTLADVLDTGNDAEGGTILSLGNISVNDGDTLIVALQADGDNAARIELASDEYKFNLDSGGSGTSLSIRQDGLSGKCILRIGWNDSSEIMVGYAAGKVGFYGTAGVSKQTGVAVDAAGIHAALVALGLITA